MKNYIRICVGIDGFILGGATTLHNSSDIVSLLSFNYPKNFGESISSITIKFKRNTSTADDTILGPGKEIDIWWSNTLTDVTPVIDALPANSFRLFRGYIIDKKLSGNIITITASDVFIKTMWTIGTSSTDINKDTTTPIKTLLTNLCTAAGLTASNNAAIPSPENIVTFYSEKQNIFERISYLLNLIGWYGYYDPTTVCTIIFQPKTAGATQEFTVANIIRIPEWSNDSRDLFNEVTLTGGSNQKTISETHTIDSGTMYTLDVGSVKPEAIIVTAQPGTYPKESWTPDEYYVASNAIIFTKGTEPTTNGNSLYIQFTYQTTSTSTTVANTDSPTSQSLYLLRQKAIQKRDTLNSTDLTSLATNLVDNDFWGKPLQEVTITVNDNVLLPILGSKADVTDPMSGRSIVYVTHNTIVYSIEFQWPAIGVRTFISSRPLKNPMQQTTVQDSVEKIQLELQKTDLTSLMRKDGSTPLISTTGYWNLGGAQLLNHRLENSIIAPVGLNTGGLYFDTSAGAGKGVGKINVGTSAAPSWTELGSGGVTAHSALTELDYASAGHTGFASSGDLASYLLLAGGTMAGAIVMSDYGITGLGQTTPTGAGTQKLGTAANTWGEVWGLCFQGADATDYISCATAGTIAVYLNSGAKFTIADAGITSALTLAMGTYNITGTGDVLPHDDGNHYCGDTTHYWLGAYTQSLYVKYPGGSANYIVTDSTGNMELHIDGVLEVIIF